MRFVHALPLVMLLPWLAACAPTTPLFVAQITTGEVAEYKQLKNKRMTAAVEEEGDLLTYSAQAIRDGKSSEAEQLYLTGYDNTRYGPEVRAIALYQIGLIYMSRYNDQRDDRKAMDYFQRIDREFPGTQAAQHADARELVIQQRAKDPVQKTAKQLLADWQPQYNLDLNKPTLDPDMTLLSRRAVLKDRVDEAAQLYLLGANDPAIPPDIREKALYQLGLMYMAPDNPHPDREKAIAYLRRQLAEFPNGELADKGARHLDRALNQTSPRS
ncbi:outer membrane assembly lipoprotein YfiO [Pseudomonas sp. GD04087]|uniref:outer membrane assembly lipoprotein YfiO n=1 Tax=Pseudomonas TaxID=286 RepID=UPI001F1C06F9|nr:MULTISPECIES: outer membrane assembly lipoprotein YfiO [Pseudomonas]MCP1646730.1 TPR repeat protein [Pseudomonas nitroreducens]MCP1685306.1 TPR repeat protein [Pseudomonas nitroreducens]MDH0289237.1 outer membrane assembly lipoprotein YfiO [Pseudomonas sp. GD04087]MDH1047912.1 outer membrane assembly lipoprotein YfiO [Pseudomonas sp. GD03903]MDH1998595.1 outer membrane assembly lipoprotein YfiO [Pseudomonas sp. GD03691]